MSIFKAFGLMFGESEFDRLNSSPPVQVDATVVKEGEEETTPQEGDEEEETPPSKTSWWPW
jgi:hypothetical protein